ncbi:GGDEF domain-containing protein [Butyrivibrio sp. XBB1001]|uniref:GGDEF domain-containing protein n=1 Tax=Butyrivibrio sp. XBB1001 TaxID=1280682 RepID=UPI000409C723|nr:GGDEF domain-containing protein [Butyrivibrio sp. XBB1001]
MINKLIDVYIDSAYYIDNNQRKVARENFLVAGDMAGFLVFLSLIFTLISFIVPIDYKKYLFYLIPIILSVLVTISHHFFEKLVGGNMLRTRIYCYLVYTVLILTFSYADAYVHREVRSIIFPAAILVISALYRDYLHLIALYKFVLIILFAVLEYSIKTPRLVIIDAANAILFLIVSVFCYVTVMRASLISKEENEILMEKSQTDLLTGLFNKLSFEDKSKELLNDRHIGAKATLFIFDLDNFKEVNDRYGHQVGDEVLKKFAEIIKSYFHPTDVFGRIGGDEFMVLVMGEMGKEFVETRCRSVLHEFKTFRTEEASGFSCSIGIVEDTKGLNFEDMYNLADKALYQAKADGKGCFFTERN